MMRVLPSGDQAVMVEVEDLSHVLDLHSALRGHPPAGTTEFVPASRTVLIRYDPDETTVARLTAELDELATRRVTQAPGEIVEVPVRYDGSDLADVARLAGLTPADVIARHQANEYRVAFGGFAPGFAYITGLDRALHVPRRDTPRTHVPRGAVAVADEFTGIYPRESPGGWRIIGHTDLSTWDLDRDPPMLLVPGSRVRFVEVCS